MCGISILFQKQSLTLNNYTEIVNSLKTIDHRGPDDEGVVLINTKTNDFKIIGTSKTHPQIQNQVDINSVSIQDYNLILGHKRLSIIDLKPTGHQPMQGIDKSWIVFNGEIYNYLELKIELVNLGCLFSTQSDTEVVLEAYRVWGVKCLDKFNGMWSIVIWDASKKEFFISNDRFGVKPLYYFEDKNGFVLASETKQFKNFSNIDLVLNQKHINEYIEHSFIDRDEETMFLNIYRFRKSHYAIINPFTYKTLCDQQKLYYTIKKATINWTKDNAINTFKDLLNNAVKIRMRADVDFGFALSGGIDSSAILYSARNVLQQEHKKNELLGFSAIFPGYEAADESHFIKIVADDLPCKTSYTNVLNEFSISDFEKHVIHQDEPLHGTSFLAQWAVYKKAQESGIKILFNGQGADEVFAGYHHHFYRYCRQLLISGNVIKYLSLVNKYADLKGITKTHIHKTVFNEVKLNAKIKLGIAKFDHKLLKYWSSIDTLDEMLLRDFDTFQLPTYLRVDDRNSMAFSIESRHPFMDYKLVEFGYSLPNNLLIKDGWQKYIIRESMSEMPQEIRYRKDKKGFTTPQDVWLNKFKDEFDNYLTYNQKVYGTTTPSKNRYINYYLGAWLKSHLEC